MNDNLINKNFKIAVIENNDFNIYNYNNSPTFYDDVELYLSDYINFIDVNIDNFMTNLIKITNMNNDDLGNSDIIYYDDTYIYELSYVTFTNKNIKKNIISSELFYNKIIYGQTIIKKTNISNDIFVNESVDINDILNIIQKKNNHIGIVINTNGSIDNFFYHDNPLDWVTDSNYFKNLSYHEFELYNKIFVFIISLKDGGSDFNGTP